MSILKPWLYLCQQIYWKSRFTWDNIETTSLGYWVVEFIKCDIGFFFFMIFCLWVIVMCKSIMICQDMDGNPLNYPSIFFFSFIVINYKFWSNILRVEEIKRKSEVDKIRQSDWNAVAFVSTTSYWNIPQVFIFNFLITFGMNSWRESINTHKRSKLRICHGIKSHHDQQM